MKRKVFISMPMRGRNSNAIKDSIDTLKMTYITDTDNSCEFINTIVTDEPPQTVDQRIWYLGKSIQILSQADTLMVPQQRDQYPGCQVEYTVAKYYGLQVIEYDILSVCPDLTEVQVYYPTYVSEYDVFKYVTHPYDEVRSFFTMMDYSKGSKIICSTHLPDVEMCEHVMDELVRLYRPASSGMVLEFKKDNKIKRYYCDPQAHGWSLIDEKDV